MSDSAYQTKNLLFQSKGVAARYVDDVLPDGTYLDMNSLEEIEEAGLATRLGTKILTQEGGIARPLGGTAASVHSLSKLVGLNGNNWRYAGQGSGLYRINGLAPGAYTRISNSLSGSSWTAVPYQPLVSSYPFLFIADLSKMLKDNGTLAAPQQMGIFQPQFPISAQAQVPTEIILDPFSSSVVATTTTAAITVTGIQNVPVADLSVMGLFQSLVIDTGANQETVLVVEVTKQGITASFTKTHASGVDVVENGVSTDVPVSSTGTIDGTIATSISTWPVTLDQSDYIGLWIYVSDPNAIDSITLEFDTTNGAYFYRTIGQGPLQEVVSASADSSTTAADAILSSSLGLYMSGAGGVTGLNTVAGWTPILVQLSDFSGAGGAAFDAASMNWQNVTSYTIKIVTNTEGGATIKAASLILFGGAGPDSFAGVGYDYVFTFFNVNDYTESNPCMSMTNVNPPDTTNWVVPRRQSILLTLTNNFSNFDPQITHVRIYRRGGTLGDNYRRIDQVAWTGGSTPEATQTYLDIYSDADIQQATVVSFTNDVPVTSSLPVPVNTTLEIGIFNSGTSIAPAPTFSAFNWVNPSNADSSSLYATSPGNDNALRADVPGGSIQSGHYITGISVSWKGFSNSSGPANVTVFVGGVAGSSFPITWPASLGVLSFGSNSELWGWTASQLATGFRVSITAPFYASSTSLNSLVITVHTVSIEGKINAVEIVTPLSMDNISLYQQVSIGSVVAENFETVIVQAITSTTFQAFVQNSHDAGELITATAQYGKPVDIIAIAFDQAYFGGDSNNPSTIYWSAKGNVQSVSSASYEPASNSGDAVTAIVGTAGNLFVSTLQRWFSVAPGTTVGGAPTIYPTQVDHGCVGKNAWTLRDGTVFYLSTDGIRTFTGGGGQYVSEIIEFVWQNTGKTPIPIADPTQFSSVQASWWNRWVFFSYIAMDGKRHRIILDVSAKRCRNDDIEAESMFLEEDTGTLLYGDLHGLVHLDRQLTSSDETSEAGAVVPSPIAITLQTTYSNGGSAAYQKNYNELVIDANTGGNTVTATLNFNDGEFSEVIGTVNTSQRERVNLNLNNGDGFEAYKVSLLLEGEGTTRIFLYQCALRSVVLAQTRKSFDSYWLRMGVDESKILKQIYVETTATAPIDCKVFYDGSTVPGYTFTIPMLGGVRNSLRVRLPAVSFRLVRFIFTSTSDFMLWETSKYEWKPLRQGSGYSTALLMP